MLIQVQPLYQKQIEPLIAELNKNSEDYFVSVSHQAATEVLIGDFKFLEQSESEVHFKPVRRIAVVNAPLDPRTVVESTRQKQTYVVSENKLDQISVYLHQIKMDLTRKAQIEHIRTDIQKKRKDLEQLNQSLKSESDQKIQSLELTHHEEVEKNQNEKSLLHFLDFIQSESISDDFPEKLFRFIWKDLKKFGRVYTLGFGYVHSLNKAKLTYFNGREESSISTQVDFNSNQISKQLAVAWGRPVGSILRWLLPENSRPTYLFIEVVDHQIETEKIQSYFNERLAVLSLYLDRWLIEKEIELVVNRWKNTFKSFSGYTHVIDENFKIYHSNYPYPREAKERAVCYKVLAGRDTPCESCPILIGKNSNLALKPDQIFKTYYSQFRFENKNYYFVIYEDLTKIRSLHTQIIQTEKMSTLGRLGNHLAHEMNNPLTGIKSYIQMILQDRPALESLPSTAATDLNEILKAAVRCQKIIKNFIDFSQKKEPVLEPALFSEVLQNTLVLLKSALRTHRLFIDLKDQQILANSHDLQQVLFNMIKNACQAMKATGSIKIYQEVVGRKIHYHIEDSGPGFDETVLKNMFQPFTTTKAEGEGTGLGLYLSKKLINNMQADLQVSSTSHGAKVTLIFDML